jgi:hypothetical protein
MADQPAAIQPTKMHARMCRTQDPIDPLGRRGNCRAIRINRGVANAQGIHESSRRKKSGIQA